MKNLIKLLLLTQMNLITSCAMFSSGEEKNEDKLEVDKQKSEEEKSSNTEDSDEKQKLDPKAVQAKSKVIDNKKAEVEAGDEKGFFSITFSCLGRNIGKTALATGVIIALPHVAIVAGGGLFMSVEHYLCHTSPDHNKMYDKIELDLTPIVSNVTEQSVGALHTEIDKYREEIKGKVVDVGDSVSKAQKHVRDAAKEEMLRMKTYGETIYMELYEEIESLRGRPIRKYEGKE